MKVALSSGSQNQKADSAISKPLKEQAFAAPEKVAEIVQKVYPRSIALFLMNKVKSMVSFVHP